jgi:hypothetical protein
MRNMKMGDIIDHYNLIGYTHTDKKLIPKGRTNEDAVAIV